MRLTCQGHPLATPSRGRNERRIPLVVGPIHSPGSSSCISLSVKGGRRGKASRSLTTDPALRQRWKAILATLQRDGKPSSNPADLFLVTHGGDSQIALVRGAEGRLILPCGGCRSGVTSQYHAPQTLEASALPPAALEPRWPVALNQDHRIEVDHAAT